MTKKANPSVRFHVTKEELKRIDKMAKEIGLLSCQFVRMNTFKALKEYENNTK